jgi:DNA modification methylase
VDPFNNGSAASFAVRDPVIWKLLMTTLEIRYRLISDLQPRKTNPRKHSKKQLEQLANSIKHYGFTNPVLIDEAGGVIAGHGRLEAAKILGITEVPTVALADMSEADVRSYVIADNQLALNAGWDRDLLGLEFKYLAELDFDFDLTTTGFELPEIDFLIGSVGSNADADPDDVLPELSSTPAVTRPGDLWQIGSHRLICGDATIAKTYEALFGDERAEMVFSDAPYNVPIQGHVSGLGKAKHREFAMASGEMSSEQFTSFLARAFVPMAKFSVDGAIHYQCMDWRHAGEILAAGAMAYHELKNLCVWAKRCGGMGSLYRSAHELVFVFKSGKAPHVNNVELGKHGRYRTNVWSYPGSNSFGANRDEQLAMHPTVKPLAMVADAILDCSTRKGIVLDPFAGSGTTLLAAQRTGRRGYGIEIDPAYCDLIIARLTKTPGIEAILAASRQSFAEVEQERLDCPLGEAAA